MTKNAAGISSEDAKRFNDKRIESGTHNFLGPDMNRKRINDGTHHLLGGKIAKRNAEKRLKDGTHHFLEEGCFSQTSSNKKNKWNSQFSRRSNAKRDFKKIVIGGETFLSSKRQMSSLRYSDKFNKY